MQPFLKEFLHLGLKKVTGVRNSQRKQPSCSVWMKAEDGAIVKAMHISGPIEQQCLMQGTAEKEQSLKKFSRKKLMNLTKQSLEFEV